MFYTATDGVLVRTGRRQSMPSSSMDSCARLNDTAPCSACGQMKRPRSRRSEEHTSELQSHSFISYAVFCLKKKNQIQRCSLRFTSTVSIFVALQPAHI